jgi:AbrB family looped-hinge helix DNA binding protein
MAANMNGNEIQVGAQGRLVIPAALRKALGLKPGDRLVARQEGGALVLERREAIEQRLWQMFAGIPMDVSLVDELLAERRVDARRENANQ